MARVQLVNENDEIIGDVERSERKQSDIYRVASAWITNSQGNVLMSQRSHTKDHNPGKWAAAASGTMEVGETYDSCIIKELREELGLTSVQPVKGQKIRVSNDYNFFCQWYLLTVDKPADEFTIQKDEVEQVKWFGYDELAREVQQHPEHFTPSTGMIVQMFAPGA